MSLLREENGHLLKARIVPKGKREERSSQPVPGAASRAKGNVIGPRISSVGMSLYFSESGSDEYGAYEHTHLGPSCL
jgi:hypothetical protein